MPKSETIDETPVNHNCQILCFVRVPIRRCPKCFSLSVMMHTQVSDML